MADRIVAEAKANGINTGLIVVASIYNANVALAMRTLDNDGWGQNTEQFALEQQERISLAIESTQSAINSRRPASVQRDYLNRLGRAADAYDKAVPGFVGRSVYLGDFGMVATFQSRLNEAYESELLVLDAVYSTTKEITPPRTFLNALTTKLRTKIYAEVQSGIVMTSLNRLSKDSDPIFLGVQALGPLNTGIGNVVAAKMRASIRTEQPSTYPYLEGAVLLHTSALEYGKSKRIVGVGGLKLGSDDRKIIEECIAEDKYLSVLNTLS